MVKKIVSVGAAAAVFLSAAAPAFAGNYKGWSWMFHRNEDELTIENVDTDVDVDVNVTADSGDNYVSGSKSYGGWWSHFFGGGSSELHTGSAVVDEVGVLTDTNFTEVAGCGCFDDVSIENRDTDVDVDVDVRADSGDNTLRGRGELHTGMAGVGTVLVQTYTNTTMVGGSAE